MVEEHVIIVAGGTGSRMKNKLPKQFIVLNGKPIILHTINRFLSYNKQINIVIALQRQYFEYWKNLCKTYNFERKHQVVEAGEERYFTVKNALEVVSSSDGIVAIHDAVRPMVSVKTISLCFEKAKAKNNCIPTVPLFDSIRKITTRKTKALNRNNYVAVQTPQCFGVDKIIQAYQQPYKKSFTDDASVYEAFGEKIFTIEGNFENRKITTPTDLFLAECLLKDLKD